jgi:LmbE family N-acetylglucosaminyl deacetylase
MVDHEPEVAITHLVDDVHPDHRHTAEAVLVVSPQAVIATGRPRRVNSCDSYHHLDRHARAPRTFQ